VNLMAAEQRSFDVNCADGSAAEENLGGTFAHIEDDLSLAPYGVLAGTDGGVVPVSKKQQRS
jgi:hypothetical protein